ncbi:hypothetical protein [Kushneria sp. TE3]|uniref:hypothetical protein n=1 Tax=Kushneria sp. TE3 TaxID=3449832 RepID=UPI003F6896EC
MSDNAASAENLYIPYPAASKFLSEQWGITAEELAALLWLGWEDGGLTAYRNANEFTDPPQVLFLKDEPQDLFSLLGSCWFKKSDLEDFKPLHRFVSGKDLRERWENKLGIPVESFIQAKIEESRLLDFSILIGSSSEDTLSKLEPTQFDNVLFLLEHIETIETEDMAISPSLSSPFQNSNQKTLAMSNTERARHAGNVRHSQPNGNREKREKVRDRWDSGEYYSRNQCAEKVSQELGMSISTARKALINTLDPENWIAKK